MVTSNRSKFNSRRIEVKFAGQASLSVSNTKTHHLNSPGRVVKNRIFGDLKSVKIKNRRIEIKFEG